MLVSTLLDNMATSDGMSYPPLIEPLPCCPPEPVEHAVTTRLVESIWLCFSSVGPDPIFIRHRIGTQEVQIVIRSGLLVSRPFDAVRIAANEFGTGMVLMTRLDIDPAKITSKLGEPVMSYSRHLFQMVCEFISIFLPMQYEACPAILKWLATITPDAQRLVDAVPATGDDNSMDRYVRAATGLGGFYPTVRHYIKTPDATGHVELIAGAATRTRLEVPADPDVDYSGV